MKVRIKHRVHGIGEGTLQPGQVVDLPDEEALNLIRHQAAEEVAHPGPPSGGAENAAALAALQQENAALKKENTTLQKQVQALQKAVQKAKAKPAATAPEETRPE